MEVHLQPDLEARLSRIASARGSNLESLAQEAIQHFVEYDDWFIDEVEKGIASVESGSLLDHEEVRDRLESLISKRSQSA